MNSKVLVCLSFDGKAEEAANFYVNTFTGSRITAIHRAPTDYPDGREGAVLTVDVDLLGMRFILLNGGVRFDFSEATSFQVATEDQAETDRYWDAITSNGGKASMCGWCQDRFGLMWQITPRQLTDYMAQGGQTAERAFTAMMTMSKIDIAALERAVAGTAP